MNNVNFCQSSKNFLVFKNNLFPNNSYVKTRFQSFSKNNLPNDQFIFNSHISFKKADGPSDKTLKYIKYIYNNLSKETPNLITLEHFDLNAINDICAGIDVFKGFDANDLSLLANNLKFIALARGCYHQCSHCSVESNNKITFMNWDNYVDLIDGMATIKDRLGFNPFFNLNLNSNNIIHPFMDSDPFSYRSIGLDKKAHNIYDAAKYFYDKTGSTFTLTTAGWEKVNKSAQQSAINLSKNPNCINSISISIHPFHHYMENSRIFLAQGQIEKSDFWKEKYVDMIANMIETLAPLFKINKANIILEGTNDSATDPFYSFDSSLELLKEILRKVKDSHPNEDCSMIDYNNLLEKNAIQFRDILYLGRAERFINSPIEKLVYSITKAKHKDVAKFDRGNLLDLSKSITPDGQVLVNLSSTALKFDFSKYPKQLNFKHPTKMTTIFNYPAISDSQIKYTTPRSIIERDESIRI